MEKDLEEFVSDHTEALGGPTNAVKPKAQFTNTLLGESALAKDWNEPEEDEAWQNL